ncbi:MAG: protein TolR [Inquilinaceae bacterium]
MGASLPSHGAARTGRRRIYRPMAEINVTPFVDVMLVLLIVFMVTAPLLTVGVPVDLPQTRGQNISEPDEPLVVSIDSDGQIFVQESVVEMGNLVPLLVAVTEANPDVRIFVRGDRSIAYGQIMQVMGSINAAGFTRVALVAELPSGSAQ